MVTASISFCFSIVINDPQVNASKQPSLLSHSSVGQKKENSLPLSFVAAHVSCLGISSKPTIMVVLPTVAFGWLCPPFCLPFPFFAVCFSGSNPRPCARYASALSTAEPQCRPLFLF